MREFDISGKWSAFVHWKGWKKLFFLPFSVALLLFVVCGAALIWVFLEHMEQQPFAYGLYAMSAYLLTDLCVRLPSGVRNAKGWLERHPKVKQVLQDGEAIFVLKLYAEQFINFIYGIFKTVAGVVIGSAWIGSDGIYNLVQALIQLFQILRRKKAGDIKRQWRAYRFCGVMILVMHLTLIGIVFQTVNWNRAEEAGEIMVTAGHAVHLHDALRLVLRGRTHRDGYHQLSEGEMLSALQPVRVQIDLIAPLGGVAARRNLLYVQRHYMFLMALLLVSPILLMRSDAVENASSRRFTRDSRRVMSFCASLFRASILLFTF